ncbi:MAG: rhomboid family intramembrane serine protease [Thermoproteota archaeon]
MFPIHDKNKPTKTPFVNYGLLIINIAVFFLFFLPETMSLNTAIQYFGSRPQEIIHGEKLWTLLTSMFMHGGIMHLGGNMIYLWVFGDNIEDVLGHGKYLVFYLLGGLVATFTHIGSVYLPLPSLSAVNASIPSVGASGAISAVLGAYLILYPKAKIRTLTFYFFITIVTIPAYYYLGFWFVYQLLMGFIYLTGVTSSVAFWAHIGGFAVGMLAVKLFRVKPRTRESRTRRGAISPLWAGTKIRRPFVDLMMEDSKVRVLAELPGVNREDIDIQTSRREAVISAKQNDETFYKRISLPVPVDPKIYDFYYRNGVLSFYLNQAS